MLQVIRDRAQGLVVYAIVGLIIVTFALWGINEYFQGDRGVQVATVNGENISQFEYQLALSQERGRMQQLFGGNFDPAMFEGQMKQAALDQAIQKRLLVDEALANGLRVSDDVLAQTIRSFDWLQEDGRFSKALYEQQLRAQGLSPSGFENQVRQQMLIGQLADGIMATSFATEKERADRQRLEGQTRSFGYFTIPLEDFTKDLEISDEEARAFYEENKDRYQTPERVSIEYLELSAQALASEIKVDDEELKAYYDAQKSRFTQSEERRASHILIEAPADASSEVEAKAKAEAQKLHERLAGGASFEELAKKHSDDPGSASQGGDLGFFGKGIMDPAFEDTAFSLEEGGTSEPVRSAFGYHIIKVTGVRGGETKSFAEVKDELAAELRKSEAEKLYFDRAETLANMTFEHPDSLQAAAEELGLQVKSTPLFTRSGGPGIAGNRQVVEVAFGAEVLQDGLNSRTIEIGDNHSVVVRVKEHHVAAARPFEQVRQAVVNELKNRKARDMIRDKGEALVAEVKQGKDPQALAKANKYTWKPQTAIKRDAPGVPADLVREAFRMPAPVDGVSTTDGFALSGGDYVVVQLTEVKDADPANMAEPEQETVNRQLAGAHGAAEFQSLMESLEAKAEIKRFPNNL